jgi:hypothetical protein
LGINSVSTETVNEYELGLQIRLSFYRIEFNVNRSDLLRYAGVHSAKCWAVVVGHWATDWAALDGSNWTATRAAQQERKGTQAGPSRGWTGFQPIRLGKIENSLSFSKSFINFKPI